ncbi:MAG: dCTP deaminase domain-containing protein [Nitrososphaerales archaeon]
MHILSGEEISKLVKQVTKAGSGEQIQPAGYDVTVSNVYAHSKSVFTLGISKSENSKLEQITANADGFFDLGSGIYKIELNEITTIPKDAIGILFPRSTLLRNGIDVRTALFDPGYSGQPSVMLVCHRPLKLERFSRIGQLVIIQSDSEFAKQYSGQYQGERGK